MAFAGVTRHDVLVVANVNSPASVAVANYYAAKRGIPASHVRTVSCTTSESINPAGFASLRDQIKTHLVSLGSAPDSAATDPISTIVLCTGVPHKVTDSAECYSAVDTALAGCFTESTWGKEPLGIYGDYQAAPGFPNPYTAATHRQRRSGSFAPMRPRQPPGRRFHRLGSRLCVCSMRIPRLPRAGAGYVQGNAVRRDVELEPNSRQ